MQISVFYHKSVELELRDATKWYHTINPELKIRFKKEVKNIIGRITENPLAYQKSYNEIRSAFLEDFPYGIHFVFKNSTIKILAILHTSRNPEIWQERS